MTELTEFMDIYMVDPHRTFGGLIFESDFNTEYRGRTEKQSPAAKRIVAARRFDNQCRQHADARDRRLVMKEAVL